ncbi:MAG: hypothetical protein IJ545_02810 [Alphaproteobacteria bacterium]|nr:hypothetical protein [Alphaproteobacteria bacterium]
MSEENKSSGLKVLLYTCGIAACTMGTVKSCEASLDYNKQHNIKNFGVVEKTHDLEAAESNNIYGIWTAVCGAGLVASAAGLMRERKKNLGR